MKLSWFLTGRLGVGRGKEEEVAPKQGGFGMGAALPPCRRTPPPPQDRDPPGPYKSL